MDRGRELLLSIALGAAAALVVATAAWFVAIESAGAATDDEAPAGSPHGVVVDVAAIGEWIPSVASEPEHPALAAARAFYESRDGALAWLGGDGRRVRELLDVLRAADEHGLEPETYGTAALARALEEDHDPATRRRLDAALSTAFLLHARHLARGRVGPDVLEAVWHLSPPDPDLAAALERATNGEGPRAALTPLAPQHDGYRHLQAALARYREIAANGGWTRVPDGPTLRPGDTTTRTRLAALVDRIGAEPGRADTAPSALPQAAANGTPRYTEALADAVRDFQRRHGIEDDGVVGPNTLRELNMTAEERVEQIAINLERWRWLRPSFPSRYVHVDVADFVLRAYEDGEPVLEMPVVVGRPDWRTPLFSDEIERVVLNPYWNVPASITRDEILPTIRRDPGYLSRKNMEVLSRDTGEPLAPSAVDWSRVSTGDIRLRQRPGPENALGRIKFIFPNRFSVYLHDTPAEHYFEETERDFSHGCVRVERPLDLARFILAREDGWSAERARDVIESRERQVIRLAEPIPVYLLYWTAHADAEGRATFEQDIYDLDATLARALPRPPIDVAAPSPGGPA